MRIVHEASAAGQDRILDWGTSGLNTLSCLEDRRRGVVQSGPLAPIVWFPRWTWKRPA